MATNTLEADGILYRIGDHNLLTDIYLKCQTGEIVGLLGRNGCGKSTLLKIIFGLLPTENKSVRINGQPYQRPFAHHLICYLPQEHFLPRSDKVRNLISLFVPSVENQQTLCQDPVLQPLLHQKVGELSGGQQRYLEVAMLLQLDAPFVLLDEPFSGIDPQYKEKIQELLRAHRPAKGIVVTDHNYQQIIEVSDRLLLLRQGACRVINQLQDLEDWDYVPKGHFS